MNDSPRQFGPETQGAIYLRGLGGAKPDIPTSFTGLEAAAKQKMSPEAWAYTAGVGGIWKPRRTPIAPRLRAFRSRRACSPAPAQRNLGCEIFGAQAAAPLFSSSDRRAGDDASRRRPRRRARDGAAQPADDHFEPGVVSDGGDRQGQRRRAALLSALLGQVRRGRRELRQARRGDRLPRHLHHARHAGARLASARSRSSASRRSCAGRASHNIPPTPPSARCCRKRRKRTRRPPRSSSRRCSPIRASTGSASPRSDRGRNFPSC